MTRAPLRDTDAVGIDPDRITPGRTLDVGGETGEKQREFTPHFTRNVRFGESVG